MVSLDAPLDRGDPQAGVFLGGLQGNILKAHARDHAVHLVIRFGADQAASRRWLARFGRDQVTSAAEQYRQIATFKSGGDGGTFAGVALSKTGYTALGIPASDHPADPSFVAGMKNSSTLRASDPPPNQWQAEYEGAIDALVIVADQNLDRLATVAGSVQDALVGAGATVHAERGDTIFRDDPRAGRLHVEHFGLADGLSQPEVIKQDIETEIALRGSRNWNPGAPLGLLLARESAGGFGSYLVFRKLEQNVQGFLAAEQKLIAAVGLDGNAARVEGLIVGRGRDGYPAISTQPEPDASPGNDFNFDNDRFGVFCPYQAHVRRTNPRGDLTSPGPGRPAMSSANERMFRIARRGIPYGGDVFQAPGVGPSKPPPVTGAGLLFMSVQFRLQNFEIQQGGCDSNDFPLGSTGVDAVIGHNAAPQPQRWTYPPDLGPSANPHVANGTGEVQFTMANFVTLLGGEYFFLPSMTFLHGLSG
jgi:deferrochelatase/peroxidase EfeB